ncbi:MAG TPA: hypothetical protein VFR41_14770 [Acidimicrobiia bacterium]|nr:hypothetical protein [Acidimicrobiia bacterium]
MQLRINKSGAAALAMVCTLAVAACGSAKNADAPLTTPTANSPTSGAGTNGNNAKTNGTSGFNQYVKRSELTTVPPNRSVHYTAPGSLPTGSQPRGSDVIDLGSARPKATKATSTGGSYPRCGSDNNDNDIPCPYPGYAIFGLQGLWCNDWMGFGSSGVPVDCHYPYIYLDSQNSTSPIVFRQLLIYKVVNGSYQRVSGIPEWSFTNCNADPTAGCGGGNVWWQYWGTNTIEENDTFNTDLNATYVVYTRVWNYSGRWHYVEYRDRITPYTHQCQDTAPTGYQCTADRYGPFFG